MLLSFLERKIASNGMIPARVPESHDFSQTDFVPIEQRPLQSSSSISDFCFRNDTVNLESPAADELFLNGKSIPIEIKNIISPSKHVRTTSKSNSRTIS
ncbi:hypothetical protein OIU79_022347 [Salix purpurea]|uniref:Uncharacterized protein n=1 Tax=Salix purpurea TaxID=77065 RepID=A0A9Q0WIE1_SALPP|nr:hypothetical protein OIU79_022347 [Salix purpurea]